MFDKSKAGVRSADQLAAGMTTVNPSCFIHLRIPKDQILAGPYTGKNSRPYSTTGIDGCDHGIGFGQLQYCVLIRDSDAVGVHHAHTYAVQCSYPSLREFHCATAKPVHLRQDGIRHGKWAAPVVEDPATISVLTADHEDTRADARLQLRREPPYKAAVVQARGKMEAE